MFDLLVIGGGSGGIAAATRAAEYGAKVAIVEGHYLGGTCVNLGCIPKKIMFNGAFVANIINKASHFGFSFSGKTNFNWGILVKNREDYLAKLRSHYQHRLSENNIQVISGYGRFINSNTVEVNQEKFTAKHIIIATGGRPFIPSSIKNTNYAIDSDSFFALKKQPKEVAIIGGGYIGVEFTSTLQSLGSRVHLIMRKANPLSQFDSMLGEQLANIMSDTGIILHRNTEANAILKQTSGKKKLMLSDNTIIDNLDEVLLAVGRVPNIEKLELSKIGLKLTKNNTIDIDDKQNTNITGIYAIGDVTSRPALTPVAIAAGRKLCDRLFNNEASARLDYNNIPKVAFSHPPVSTVGLSEEEAYEKFGKNDVRIYQTKFNPLFDALSPNKTPTGMKLITIGQEEKIVGIHALGYNLDEIMQGFAVAIKMGARKSDFDNTMAIHPTSAEELVRMK